LRWDVQAFELCLVRVRDEAEHHFRRIETIEEAIAPAWKEPWRS
jgi:hypothetical protein